MAYAADPASKPQRFSEDSKIIGYGLIKEPSIFYQKILKLSNIIYPNSGAAIEQQAAMIKPILDSSVAIGVVIYSNDSFQQVPFVGVYITVKDKTVFNNPMINMFPSHEIVENTLVISTNPASLPKFKEFQKNIVALKSQKDIEVFIDIKNIVKLNDNLITDKTPYAKDLYSQVEMVMVKLDLQDTGIESSSSLISTDKSNFQTMLTQPVVDSLSLLKYSGIGNFELSVANYDLGKAKGFVKDLIKVANLIPELTDSEKKLIKEIEPIALEFCNSEVITTATSMNFSDLVKTKNILKSKDPAQFIKRLKSLYTLFSNPDLKNVFDKSGLKGINEFKWEEVEKYKDLQVYKIAAITNESDKALLSLIPMSMDQFIAADQTYCYAATDLVSLKELIDLAKSNPKAEIPLESFNHFKSGSSAYVDIFLVGYVKLLEGVLKPFNVKLDSLLALKLPPLKIAAKFDGNATIQSFIETATISTLVQKGMEAYQKSMMGGMEKVGGGDQENPNSQP